MGCDFARSTNAHTLWTVAPSVSFYPKKAVRGKSNLGREQSIPGPYTSVRSLSVLTVGERHRQEPQETAVRAQFRRVSRVTHSRARPSGGFLGRQMFLVPPVPEHQHKNLYRESLDFLQRQLKRWTFVVSGKQIIGRNSTKK